MADFHLAYHKTNLNERGYSINPNDRGNWTGGAQDKGILIGTLNGISAPVLQAYLGHVPTTSEMKNLPLQVQMNIYKEGYWDVMRGDDFESQYRAEQLYDSCVNKGATQAIRICQDALEIQQTGRMDKYTFNKLNSLI